MEDNMVTIIAYKVVHEYIIPDGTKKLLSAAIWNYNIYTVEYKVGEFVKPVLENSKLFVFDNIYDAALFSHSADGNIVYRCEVKNPTVPEMVSNEIDSYGLEMFWINGKGGIKTVTIKNPIRGTLLVDEVKLLEKIELPEWLSRNY